MTKNFDELNETFDVAADIVSTEPVKDTPKHISTSASSTEDVKKDYEYTRGNLYSIIEKVDPRLLPRQVRGNSGPI